MTVEEFEASMARKMAELVNGYVDNFISEANDQANRVFRQHLHEVGILPVKAITNDGYGVAAG